MMKLFLGIMGGVFVGALLIEILHRKEPSVAKKLEEKAKRVAARIGIPEECHEELEANLARAND